MIFQDSFIELEQKYNIIDERIAKDLYGMPLLNFLNLPKEYQEIIMNAYCASTKKTIVEDFAIEEFVKKNKTLKIFKRK